MAGANIWCSCIDFTEYRGDQPAYVTLSKELSKLSPVGGGQISSMNGVIKYNKLKLYIKLYQFNMIKISAVLKRNWQGMLTQSLIRLYARTCPVGALLHKCLLERSITPPVLICNCSTNSSKAFLVGLPFVKGETLRDRFARTVQEGKGWISEKESLRIFCEILRAVYYINSAGLVHGDLNHGNIILKSTGGATIIDTDAIISANTAMNKGLMFAPFGLEDEYTFIGVIRDRFASVGKEHLFRKWIDYFMLIFNSIIIAVISSKSQKIVEEVEDTCCWEEFLNTQAARVVDSVLGRTVVRDHLASIIRDPISHIKSENKLKKLYNIYFKSRGKCKEVLGN